MKENQQDFLPVIIMRGEIWLHEEVCKRLMIHMHYELFDM